jgi:exopolysaccharide biosynthesis polyprenyl glycosylphosphotransferase
MTDRRQLLVKAYKLFDILVMSACFALVSWLSYLSQNNLYSFDQFLSIRIKIQNFILFIVLIFLWQSVLNIFNLYKSHRLSKRWKEVFDVMKATLLGTFILYVVGIIFSISIINLSFISVFWITCAFVMIASRLLLRWSLHWARRRGRNLRHMLIIGTNRRAVDFAQKIESRPELGYRLAGFVDSHWEGMPEFQKMGYKVVTDIEGFPTYLRENVIDELVISLPLKSQYKNASLVASMAQEQGITVRYLPDIFDLKTSRMKIDFLEGLPLISNFIGAMEGWQVEIKRIMDILISAVALIILSPVFVMTTIVIKLTSPGPVFFIQDRVGLNKRRFRLYKFRTMIPGAEKKQARLEALNEASGPVFKIKNDPRITPIGKILRKSSIDELPQLFNVFKGEMSLVGPRPLPIRDYNGFSEDWHRRRFSVRPGITCLWQVNGRCDTSFEEWIEFDMEYIDNWSLWMDLKILFLTVPAVLRGSGAA